VASKILRSAQHDKARNQALQKRTCVSRQGNPVPRPPQPPPLLAGFRRNPGNKKQGCIRARYPQGIPHIDCSHLADAVVIRVFARPPAPLSDRVEDPPEYLSTTGSTSACAGKERKVTYQSSRLPSRYFLEQGLAQVGVALWLHYLQLLDLSSFFREPLPVAF
jgi:hypothetical protein